MPEVERPPIPMELRRRILVEAGHRCAIPTCRHIEVEVHHIIPWEKCHEHKYENLIALCPNCHSLADREKIDRISLRMYKANLRYTHERFSQFEVDMLFQCHESSGGVQWPDFLMLLIKRLLDSEYVARTTSLNGMFVNGMKISPDILTITEKGKAFVESLGTQELCI